LKKVASFTSFKIKENAGRWNLYEQTFLPYCPVGWLWSRVDEVPAEHTEQGGQGRLVNSYKGNSETMWMAKYNARQADSGQIRLE
jgi:hypothetical protein